jgi:hypothetical protein
MRSSVLKAVDVPELAEMVTVRQPLTLTTHSTGPVLQALLSALGVEHALAVPLLAGEEQLGVATASWGEGPAPVDRAGELVLRLSGSPTRRRRRCREPGSSAPSGTRRCTTP